MWRVQIRSLNTAIQSLQLSGSQDAATELALLRQRTQQLELQLRAKDKELALAK